MGLARSRRFCRLRAAAVAVVATALALALPAAVAQTAPPISKQPEPPDVTEDARRVLASHGLTQAGRHWLCAEDVRLRRQLDSLDRLEKQYHQNRRTLDQRIDENAAAGRLLAETQRQVAAHQQLLAAATDAALRRRLGDGRGRLAAAAAAARSRYLTPEKFAEDASLRTVLIDWISARNALASITLNYPTLLARGSERYEKLGGDDEVKRAVAALGDNVQLGGGRNLAAAGQKIEELRRLSLSADAPLYRVSGQWRSSLLIADTTPAACTLAETGPTLLLPDSVARAAGVVIDKATPRQRFAAPDGRQLEARVVQLRGVRLGPRTISSVEALVLPPDAEDLGVILNRSYLGGQQTELQPERLRMVIR